MDVFHMSCLRRICHISLRERKTNDSIFALCKIYSVRTPISYRDVARMSNDKLPKQMLFSMLAHAQDGIEMLDQLQVYQQRHDQICER